MSEPITWRTVVGPSLAEAARPMEAAGQSINGAFDKIAGILQQREQMDINNVNARRNANTQAYLNELYSQYKTPEALAAAQASGAVDQLKAKFNGLIDSAAVRGADETRLATLRDQTLKGQEFGDKQQQIKDRPLVNGILSTLYKGDGEGAMKLLDASPHLLNHADVQKQVADYMHTLKQRGREDTRFTWDEATQKYTVGQRAEEERLRPLRERSLRAGIAASETSTAANAYSLKRSQEADQAVKDAATLRAQLADNPYLEGIYKDSNAEDLRKLMKDNNIGDSEGERSKIIDRVSKLKEMTITVKNPQTGVLEAKKIPIPLGAVKAAILGSEDQMVNMWNQGWANTVENRLKAELQGNDLAQERTLGHYLKWDELMNAQAKAPQQAPKRR